MFSPAKLTLYKSNKVAFILAIPLLATLLLVLSADISWPISLIFLAVYFILSYRFIAQIALLNTEESIHHIEFNNNRFTLFDQEQNPLQAELASKSIITPWLCLLCFNVDRPTKKKNFIRGVHDKSKCKQYVLICRYNIRNADAFRRLRVILSFISPSS